MPAKTRWMVAAAIVLLAFAVFLWIRPRPVSFAPEPVVTKTPPVAAPGPESPVASPPQSDPVPPAPFVEDLLTEELLVDAMAMRSAIRGRVTDRWGKPVARAEVHAKDAVRSGSTDTDKDGNYDLSDLEPGNYELVATHEDYSDSSPISAATESSDAHLLLPPLATIDGRVVAVRDGQPVADFRIRPEAIAGSLMPEEGQYKRVRDDQGRFTLDRIKAGTTAVSVGAKGFADAVITFPAVRADEAREGLVIRLDTGAVLQGRVVDAQGRSVKFARVSGGIPRRGAVSETDGSFSLDSLPAGPIELTVKHENYAPKVVQVGLARGIINRTTIVLDEGAVLEGEITFGGKGAPGVVSVHHESGTTQNAQAAEDGHYRIEGVPDGRLRVECTVEPFDCAGTRSKSKEIAVADGVASRVDFDFPSGTAEVQGTVFTAPGTPYRGGGRVTALYNDFTLDGPTLGTIRAEITLSGTYSICLPSGGVSLSLMLFDSSGYEGSIPLNFTLELQDGEHLRRDVFLYGGATLRITLTGRNARTGSAVLVFAGEVAVREITESFMNSVSVIGQAPIDIRGTATVRGLAPGTYTVLAIAPPTPDEVRAGSLLSVLGTATVVVAQDQELDLSISTRLN